MLNIRALGSNFNKKYIVVERDGANVQPSPATAGQAYQRLTEALQTDPRCAHEVALSRRVGLYRFCGDIGRGNFSRVKLAIHQITRDKVAVKIVDRGRLDNRALRMLSREISTLECVHHPNILRLYEVVETLGRVYLVTEWIQGGELYNRITEEGPLTEAYAASLFKQLLMAVQHMHNLGFVHRDIKAENVLLVTENRIKLADFGFSTQLLNGSQQHLDTFCGSPPYAAPELFSDDHYIGGPVDVWALGVLLYFMVIGNMPFRAPTVPSLRSAVLKGEYSLPAVLSLPCLRFLQRILVHIPSHRPSIEDLLSSQWIEEAPFLNQALKQKSTKKQPCFSKSRKNRKPESDKHTSIDTNLVQLNFSTKRTFSVLEPNFLHPSLEEVQPVLQKDSSFTHSKSIFSSTFKKKIGPMEQKTKGKFFHRTIDEGRPFQNGDESAHVSSKARSSVTSNNLPILTEEIDQGLLEDKGEFLMSPTVTADLVNLHPLEVEARTILLKLGISGEMLCQAIASGPRSDIIGAYRIVIHRLQKQQIHANLIDSVPAEDQPSIPKNNHRLCAIL